jgi:hypothetical protein
MTFISNTRLAISLNDNAGGRLRSTVQEWPVWKTRELLPGLLLNLVTFAIRLLPGMATFNPTMLSLIIGIVLHNIAGTAAWAKRGVTLSLRWPVGDAVAMGLETNIGRLTVKGFRPCLFGALALFVAGFSLTLIGLMGVTLYDFGAASHFHRSCGEAARHAGSTRTEFDAISHQRRHRDAGNALRDKAV